MPAKVKNNPPSPKASYAWFDELSLKNTNYFSRRADKEHLPSQPYVFNNTEAEGQIVGIPGTSYSYSCLDDMGSASFINRWAFGVLPGIDDTTNLKEKVRTRVNNALRVKAQGKSMELPVSILEAQKTMATFSSVVRDIATSFRALTRGQPTEAINVLLYGSQQGYRRNNVSGALANRWLEWSYGIKPMILDVEGAALGLAKMHTHDVNRMVQITVREDEFFRRQKRTPSNPAHGALFTDHSGQGALRARGDIWMQTSNLTNQALDDFGFSNFAGTAWELIPYSFVVDWFLPVGNWMNSFRPISNFTFVDGCIYYKVMNGLVRLKAGRKGIYTSVGSARSVYKERERLSSFPSFSLPIPDWDLSAKQVVSGLSLLVSGLGLGRRS